MLSTQFIVFHTIHPIRRCYALSTNAMNHSDAARNQQSTDTHIVRTHKLYGFRREREFAWKMTTTDWVIDIVLRALARWSGRHTKFDLFLAIKLHRDDRVAAVSRSSAGCSGRLIQWCWRCNLNCHRMGAKVKWSCFWSAEWQAVRIDRRCRVAVVSTTSVSSFLCVFRYHRFMHQCHHQ